ncbi:MAG: Rho termination factor N-terminal domain-containing protein [Cyanobacteria bacterium P01_H01_bin.26]
MTNAIASTLNAIDTIATVGERTSKVAATVLWFATFAAVAVTGLCINSTAAAREAYAQQTIDLAQNADEIAAMASIPYALPPAVEVAPAVTFQAFVTQALQIPATPVEIDLGPELSDEALQANWAKINPAAATSIATEPTTTEPTVLTSLTVRQLKAMAKDRHIPRYSRLRKAELITALAA